MHYFTSKVVLGIVNVCTGLDCINWFRSMLLFRCHSWFCTILWSRKFVSYWHLHIQANMVHYAWVKCILVFSLFDAFLDDTCHHAKCMLSGVFVYTSSFLWSAVSLILHAYEYCNGEKQSLHSYSRQFCIPVLIFFKCQYFHVASPDSPCALKLWIYVWTGDLGLAYTQDSLPRDWSSKPCRLRLNL